MNPLKKTNPLTFKKENSAPFQPLKNKKKVRMELNVFRGAKKLFFFS